MHSSRPVRSRLTTLFAALAILFAMYVLFVRPWIATWGATPLEANAALPGDELGQASSQTTRAITIAAPPERVWAWIAQLGRDRGGFYSYEVLENLVGARIHNVNALRPDLQRWKVGDKLWMYPEEKLEGVGHAVLQRVDPGRVLVFGTHQIGTPIDQPLDGSWSFIVSPIDSNHTRLIARGRAMGDRPMGWHAFDVIVFEPIHFMMERKMMEGIKQRAEGAPPSRLGELIEVSAFAACFVLFIAAVVQVLSTPRSALALTKVLAAGVAFQFLTFIQPPWLVGYVLVALMGFYIGGDVPRKRLRPSLPDTPGDTLVTEHERQR